MFKKFILFSRMILMFFLITMVIYSSKNIFKTIQFNEIVFMSVILFFIFYITKYYLKRENEIFIVSKKSYLGFIIVLAFIVRIIPTLLFEAPQTSDFSALYNGAINLYNENNAITELYGSYFHIFNFQLGYAFYLQTVMEIFNTTNIYILMFMNVLWGTINTVIIYKISKILFDEHEARIAGVLSACFIPHIMSMTILFNEIPANVMMYLGIYILLKDKEYKIGKFDVKFILVGFIFGVGNIFKSLKIIYGTATILYLLIKGIREKKIAKNIFNAIQVHISAAVIIFLFSLVLISSGITDQPINDSRIGMWPWLTGFNYETNGRYGGEAVELMRKAKHEWGGDYERFNEEAKEIVISNIKDDFPFKLLGLWKEKYRYVWSEPSNMYSFSIHSNGDTVDKFYDFGGKYILRIDFVSTALLYTFAFLTILMRMLKKKDDTKVDLIYIVLLGFIGAFLLGEVQTRYRYSAMFSFIILASYSISYIIKKMEIVCQAHKKKTNILKIALFIVLLLGILISFYKKDEIEIDVNYRNIGNQLIANVEMVNYGEEINDVEYAWYVFKDNLRYEVLWYSTSPTLEYDLKESGEYKLVVFVRGTDYAKQIETKPVSVELLEKDRLVVEKVDEDTVIAYYVGGNEQYDYAWYILEDDIVLEKIWYQKTPVLNYEIDPNKSYTIICFIREDGKEIETLQKKID